MKRIPLLVFIWLAGQTAMANADAELDGLLEQAKAEERAKFYAQCAGAITAEAEYLRSTGQTEAAAAWMTSVDSYTLASSWIFAQIDERIDGNPPREGDYWISHVDAISRVSLEHMQGVYQIMGATQGIVATGECRQLSELDQQLWNFVREAVSNGDIARE